MDYLLLILGIIIVLVIITDAIVTTFVPSGAGFLSFWIIKGNWKLFFALSGKKGKARLLQYCGTTTLILIFICWILFYWLGNFMIIAAHDLSVVDSVTDEPVGIWDKLYFAGYSISTLGNGDLKANPDAYRVYVAALSFSGLAFITSAVTYFIPVLQADNDKRTTSNFINVLGENPQDMISSAWNGKDLQSLEKPFQDLSTMILDLTQKNIDYPILPNFHNIINKQSFSVNLAILDESLNIIQSSIPQENALSNHTISSLRKAIAKFAGSLKEEILEPDEAIPPLPDTKDLADQGIPLQATRMKDFYEKISYRRQLLNAYIKREGWTYEDVYSREEKNKLEQTNINS